MSSFLEVLREHLGLLASTGSIPHLLTYLVKVLRRSIHKPQSKTNRRRRTSASGSEKKPLQIIAHTENSPHASVTINVILISRGKSSAATDLTKQSCNHLPCQLAGQTVGAPTCLGHCELRNAQRRL
jgi:hypothetical protein